MLMCQRGECICMFRVEKMRVDDFEFAVKLANTMNWSMATADFEFAVALEPDGCFVLFSGSERAGIITCVSFGRVGWFGNLVVTAAYRRKGAGTTLVKHAIEYLKGKGAEAIGLYTYPHIARFYRQFGFEPDGDFLVFQGKAALPATAEAPQLQKATENDIPAIINFDTECFGANRKKLLESILRDKDNTCYMTVDDQGIAGYCTATVYTETAGIGPLVCRQDREEPAPLLLQTVLNKLNSRDVFACAPANETGIVEALCNSGLKGKFLVTRMFLGIATTKRCTHMPESLERG